MNGFLGQSKSNTSKLNIETKKDVILRGNNPLYVESDNDIISFDMCFGPMCVDTIPIFPLSQNVKSIFLINNMSKIL